MSVATVLFIIATIAASWEALHTRSIGWGAIAFLSAGLIFMTISLG